MPSADLDRAARERLDADRRYNEALTALDRDIVAAASQAKSAPDLRHLGSQLLVFLQQITAYVDTKDREAAATLEGRLAAHEQMLASIGELNQQLALLQRTVQALNREHRDPPVTADPVAATASVGSGVDGVTYVAFEDRFRGSDRDIGATLQAYVHVFEGASDVIDIGCGRGEFLALLRTAGVSARGVDINQEMVAITRERGLEASVSDALTYLRSLPDESLGGLMAAQVVEHLEPGYLVALLETAYSKLRPGSPIVVETINPACWLAFFSSYLRDPTHVRPVHPDTLQYLLQATGFSRVSVRFSAPVPDEVKMKPIELGPETIGSTEPVARALIQTAHVINANAAILNTLLFSHLDYAAVGYRS
jgi:2-polyprenyl-3-methyl-5-hydroxy-6-metoxy-1,4-benzoquinol methylase